MHELIAEQRKCSEGLEATLEEARRRFKKSFVMR